MVKPVRLSQHARAKLDFLRVHGFHLMEADVRRTVMEPDDLRRTRADRWVAQRVLSERHLLRVIFEEGPHERVVVTCYPARRSRYEPTHEV